MRHDGLQEGPVESDGDMDKAVEWLREKGLAASQKKAGRIAAEGMAYAAVIDGVGVVVEVNSETDFVAKNEKFVDFVKGVAATVAKPESRRSGRPDGLQVSGTDLTVEQQQQEMVLTIGENIKVRRFARYEGGLNVPYVHMGGRIGVMVNVEVSAGLETNEKVIELCRDAAMQIAALNPPYLDKSTVPAETLEHEKEIMMIQINENPKEASKPEAIKEEDDNGQGQQVLHRSLPHAAALRQGRQRQRGKHVAAGRQGSRRLHRLQGLHPL
jgi:elongation factor Ts